MNENKARERLEAAGPAEAGKNVYTISARPMREMPVQERPRELFDRVGPENLSDATLLALILRGGVKGVNVADLARDLLNDFGSLTALRCAPDEELARRRGMGRVKAQVLKSALELARRLAAESAPVLDTLRAPAEVAALMRPRARGLDHEVFWVLQLDTKNRLKKAPVEVSRGLLNASLVHPREVFRDAIRAASAAILIVHNHPSGDPSPSSEDVRITRQLVEAGRIIDIPLLDHVVLGSNASPSGTDFFSLRESGLVEFPA